MADRDLSAEVKKSKNLKCFSGEKIYPPIGYFTGIKRQKRKKIVVFHKEPEANLYIYPEIKYVSNLDRDTPYHYNEANY